MPIATYTLRRKFLLWRWEAEAADHTHASGFALTRAGAQEKARQWVRARLDEPRPASS